MNPKETPKIIQAHMKEIDSLEQAAMFDSEASVNFETITDSFDVFEEFSNAQKIKTAKGYNTLDGLDLLSYNGRYSEQAGESAGKDFIVFGGASYSEQDIPVWPNPIHDTYEAPMSATKVSTRFLKTKLGAGKHKSVTKDEYRQEDFPTVLLLHVGSSSDKLGSSDRIGEEIKFAISKDSTGKISYFIYVEEQKTTEAVITQQVVRKDITEESGESVDARLESPSQSFTEKYFKQLDRSDADDLAYITELQSELQKAAEAMSS